MTKRRRTEQPEFTNEHLTLKRAVLIFCAIKNCNLHIGTYTETPHKVDKLQFKVYTFNIIL